MDNYAVNVLDMTGPGFNAGPLNIAGLMVGPVTRGRRLIEPVTSRSDEVGVVLECDDSHAEAIIYLLNKKSMVRAYRRGPQGAWRRLTRQEITGLKEA